jgi:hypothetical protein
MRTPLAAGLALAVLCSFTACDDGGTTPVFANTPAEVLELIEDVFTCRDIDGLASCLADDFTFYFDDDDVGKQVGEYTVPESWPLADFLNAVSKVFSNAHSLDISIETSNVGDPGPDDTTYTAYNVQIQFLVMVEPYYGYSAQGFVTFEFGAVYNEKNEKEWLVTAWRDFTAPAGSGGRNITPASFGEILVRFRKP